MNASQINTAIVTGTFTNDELASIIDAVKFARSRLTQQVKFTLRVGAKVKFHSSKRNQTIEGTISKMAQKYATISTAQGLWRVPMNMLETA